MRLSPSIGGAPSNSTLVGREPGRPARCRTGQSLQTGHGDGPLAALVGAEHARFELLIRRGLDVLQRQPLLASDCAQALSDAFAVRTVEFLDLLDCLSTHGGYHSS
jgi:hypothetical protein